MKNLKNKSILTMLSVLLIVSFIVGIMALSFREMKTQYTGEDNANENVVNEYSSAVNKATKDLTLSELPDGQVKNKIANCVGCSHTHIKTTAEFTSWMGNANAYAVLDNNIALTTGYNELSAGKTLDGNGYLITLGGKSGLSYWQGSAFVGNNKGTIKNVNFTVGAVEFAYANKIGSFTGILAVENFGTIENIRLTLTGQVYINNAGQNWSHQKTGGLVCNNKANATIKNATIHFNGGNILARADANGTGQQSSTHVGGLAYSNDDSAKIKDCTIINANIKTEGTASWHANSWVASHASGIASVNDGSIEGVFLSKTNIDGANSGKGASSEKDGCNGGKWAPVDFYNYNDGFSVASGYSAYFDKESTNNILFAKNAPVAEREIIYQINNVKTYNQLSSIVSIPKTSIANKSEVAITRGTIASGYSFVDNSRQYNGSELNKKINYDGRISQDLPVNYYSDSACTNAIGNNVVNAGTYYRKLNAVDGFVYVDDVNKVVVLDDKAINEVVISRRGLNNFMTTLPSGYDYVYSKTAKTPAVTTNDTINGKNVFTANDLASVQYANNQDVGYATVTVVAKGNYEGSVTLGFAISKRNINFSSTSKTYDGDGKFLLNLGTEHNVVAGDNVTLNFTTVANASVYNVTSRDYILSDNKNYSLGSINVTINAKQLTKEMTSLQQLESYVYNAQIKTPSVSVTDLSETIDLISYANDIASVVYSGNQYVGNATVTITAKGNYTGVIEHNFEILKKETTITFSGYDNIITNGNNRDVVATINGLEGNDVVNAVVSYYYPNMLSFAISPNKFGNYVAKAVLPSGGLAENYMLNEDYSVAFEIKPIIVSLGENVNAHGDISLFVADYLFDFNDKILFTVYPDTGYDVNAINVGKNGISIQDTANFGKSVYVIVVEDAIIEIDYNVVEMQLTYNAGNGGSINGELSQTLLRGYDANAVTAVANEGYEFKRWSDGNANATRQDVRVSATKTLTAYFEEIEINAEKGTAFNVYVLGAGIITDTVNNVSGADFSEFILDGVKISFRAEASDGHIFVRWEKVSEDNGTLVYTTLTSSINLNVAGDSITAKSIIRAVFAKADGSLMVANSVNANIANYDKLPIGFTKTVNATTYEGFKFSHWESNGKIISANAHIIITVTGQLTIKAVYTENSYYQLTFLNRRSMPIEIMTSADNNFVVPGAATEKDYNFIGWFDKNGNNYEVGSSLSLTEKLTLTARYQFVVDSRTYNKVGFVGSGNGKVDVAEFSTKETDGLIEYQYNTFIFIIADEFIENDTKKFAYWLNASGEIVSYDRNAKIYVLNDMILKPVYVAVNNVVEKQNTALVTMTAEYENDTPTKISFNGKLSLVDGYKKIEHGVIITTVDNYANLESMQLSSNIDKNMSDVNNFFLKQAASNTLLNAESGQFIINLSNSAKRTLAKNQNWYARTYIRLLDLSTNQEIVVYSTVTRFTL